MKRLTIMTVLMLTTTCAMGQVTYFCNNFFLHVFTYTGYSSYDWRYEPQRTDKERANLHGNVRKVVTNITDKTGRGFGEQFTDTTYYRTDGNIDRIIALKRDAYNPKNKFRPDTWYYEYDEEGKLEKYTLFSQVQMYNGKEERKEIHTAIRDDRGRIVSEETRNYSLNKANKWEEFGSGDKVTWRWKYDGNGQLVSGIGGPLNMSLTYQDGRLTRIEGTGAKPSTLTYDAQGRLTTFKDYATEEMDDEERSEICTTLTYNDNGDIVKAVKESWDCTSKWQRRKKLFTYIYTFNYTYDEKGNWTKAVVNWKTGKGAPTMAFTVTRTISYR